MTSRQRWPKPDLLQQRRLELGLPIEPAPVPPPLFLVFRGGIAGVALVMLTLLTLLGLWLRRRLGCSPFRAGSVLPRLMRPVTQRLRWAIVRGHCGWNVGSPSRLVRTGPGF